MQRAKAIPDAIPNPTAILNDRRAVSYPDIPDKAIPQEAQLHVHAGNCGGAGADF